MNSCKCFIFRDEIFQEKVEPFIKTSADIISPSEDTLHQGGGTLIRLESIPGPVPEPESLELEYDSDNDDDYVEAASEPTKKELVIPETAKIFIRMVGNFSQHCSFRKDSTTVLQVCNISENIGFCTPRIDKEHDFLIRKKTWTLVDCTPEMHTLPSKYVFRVKNGAPKAELVALRCLQLYGVDYLETFAPVVKLTTIRVLFATAVVLDFEIEQMEFVTAFLNGDLKEDIFMQVPEGLRNFENENKACKLQKSLEGLNQSPRQWRAKIHYYLIKHLNFECSTDDLCLYT